ncbi:alkaline phosphatase D family protein [Corynebacterium alimapuense]|nr:alkaline phosphatase D family protein [Corynebacterium alimapuense]
MHGVASGDPLPNSVILWTRVTPTVESVPGSGQGPDVRVGWEISATPDFARIVRSGTAIATAVNDHAVHVDPFELAPDTVYFYRFRLLDGDQSGRVSRIGRTRTTPLDDANSAQLRLAVCSCANFEAGYFGAYSDIARRAYAEEIDVVVHMGDYIYEYASGDYAGKYGVVRPHVPTWELRVLSDYRSRYGHYRRDVELQEAHAAAPWVVTWDDHEIANDAWSGGASDHTDKQGDWYSRRDAAMQAYLEWLPVRGGSPSRGGRIYRTLRFGRLAELNMLDLRSYRSAPGVFRPIGQESQDHTIMGQEQFEWLSARLSNTSARWNLIGTSVMMSPLNLLDIGRVVHQPLLEMVGFEDTETPVNSDQWDGYVADRERLLAQLGREHAHGRTVFLTGDIHSEWANHIVHEDRVIAAELVCSSVSAPNVDDVLTLPANNPASTSAEAHILRHNSHISHVDLDAHGYATLTITEDGAEMSWQRCTDVTVAGSGVQAGPTRRYDGARISV